MSPRLLPSDRAPGLHVAEGVHVPDDADIAPHVTVYPGVHIGSGVTLGQGCILGRPQQIDARSRAPRRPPGAPTTIGDGCLVGSATVVSAGVRVGAQSHLGDHVLLRETAVLGEAVMVGRGSAISYDTLIGDRTRLQNDCLVGAGTLIDEDVMISARVTFFDDPAWGRAPAVPPGARVGRAARLGVGVIVFPALAIGEEAVVGAASLVRADVPPRTVVAGSPAVRLRAVRDEELLEAAEPRPRRDTEPDAHPAGATASAPS